MHRICPTRLSPSDIRFTQDSIAGRFYDGRDLSVTFQALLSGRLTVDVITPIQVAYIDGLYWARTGNRRLYLYRELESLGVIQTIPVTNEDDSLIRCNTSNDGGRTIRCRDSTTAWRISNISLERRRRFATPELDNGIN